MRPYRVTGVDFPRWVLRSVGALSPLEGSRTAVPKMRELLTASEHLPSLPQRARPTPTARRLRGEAPASPRDRRHCLLEACAAIISPGGRSRAASLLRLAGQRDGLGLCCPRSLWPVKPWASESRTRSSDPGRPGEQLTGGSTGDGTAKAVPRAVPRPSQASVRNPRPVPVFRMAACRA